MNDEKPVSNMQEEAPDWDVLPEKPDPVMSQGYEEIAEGIVPLKSIRFGAKDPALAYLGEMVRENKIVSLGETVHQSDGYSRARAEMIRYLVAEEGFRVVAWEGHWRDSLWTSGYVERGEYDLYTASLGLTFEAWSAPSTLELLEWLRQWNTDHPEDPVLLFGFDTQGGPLDADVVRRVLGMLTLPGLPDVSGVGACPGAKHDTLEALYADEEELRVFQAEVAYSQERFDACNKVLKELRSFYDEHQARIEEEVGRERATYFWAALRSLEAMAGQVFYFESDIWRAYRLRDEGMADVFGALHRLRAPDARVVIFAHNAHNRRVGDILAGGFRSFGTVLDERHGKDYAPIGLFAHHVAWDWGPYSIGAGEWTAQDPNAVESILEGLGHEHLLVDLERATGDDRTFGMGAKYSFGHAPSSLGVPLDHYRGIFFMRESEPRKH